jgi:hypothetical protein
MVSQDGAEEPKRIRKPINGRGKVRIIKVPPSMVEQYILFVPDERRFMLDLPDGSTINRLTPEDESDKI